MSDRNIIFLILGQVESEYFPASSIGKSLIPGYNVEIYKNKSCSLSEISLLLDFQIIENSIKSNQNGKMAVMQFPVVKGNDDLLTLGPIAKMALKQDYSLGLICTDLKIATEENDAVTTAFCSMNNVANEINSIINKIFIKNRRKTMKHIYSNKTLESVKVFAQSHKDLSSKDVMINYLTEINGMKSEDAVTIVNNLVSGVSSFKDLYAETIGKDYDTEKIKKTLSDRLLEKIKDYTDQDANALLFNLYNELIAQSRDNLVVLSETLSETGISEAVKNFRETNKDKFDGLSREDKVQLIAEAVDACGTVSGLMSVAVNDKQFTLVPGDKNLNNTFDSAALESTSNKAIQNTFEDIINMNYTALAAYIDKDKFEESKALPVEALGAAAAADYERKKIRNAKRDNLLSMDTFAHIMGIIAQVIACIFIVLLSADILISTSMLISYSGAGILFTALMIFGISAIVFSGTRALIDDSDSIKNGVYHTVNNIKDLLKGLYNRIRGLFTLNVCATNKNDKQSNTDEASVSPIDSEETVESDIEVEIEPETSTAKA